MNAKVRRWNGALAGWLLIQLATAGTVRAQQPATSDGGGMSGGGGTLWIEPWTRASEQPVIRPDKQASFQDPVSGAAVHWEALHTFNPAAIVRDGKIVVLYRAEDDSGAMAIGGHVSRLGMAVSSDGVHFQQMPSPVFYPDNDEQKSREVPGGVEDPRLVERPEGGYVLTYTQWSRERRVYSVGVATSDDLQHWTKHGPAFAAAYDGRYAGLKYKSAGIVTERRGDRLVAAKINGKYWMYWGEIEVGLATSDDLVHWTPLEDAPGKTRVLLRARPGKADSAFPETGPPPVLTEKGIVMLYNAKNAEGAKGDTRLQPGTYSVEEAFFSAKDPSHMLARTAEPVFSPQLPFERSGQYAAGTTFAEGLVLFGGKWWMYYGCADSFVGVATAPVK
jgi:beta-1,2-mannosidase